MVRKTGHRYGCASPGCASSDASVEILIHLSRNSGDGIEYHGLRLDDCRSARRLRILASLAGSGWEGGPPRNWSNSSCNAGYTLCARAHHAMVTAMRINRTASAAAIILTLL